MKNLLFLSLALLALSSCVSVSDIPITRFSVTSGEELNVNKSYFVGTIDLDPAFFSIDESLKNTKYFGHIFLAFRELNGRKAYHVYLPYRGNFIVEVPNRNWLLESLYIPQSAGQWDTFNGVEYELKDPILFNSESINKGSMTYIGNIRLVVDEPNPLGGKSNYLLVNDNIEMFTFWIEEKFPDQAESFSRIKWLFPEILEVFSKDVSDIY